MRTKEQIAEYQRARYHSHGYKYHQKRYVEIAEDPDKLAALKKQQAGPVVKYSKSAKGLFRSWRNICRRTNVLFNLVLEDFEDMFKAKCWSCGEPATRLLRKDCSLGYFKKNVRPCCSVHHGGKMLVAGRKPKIKILITAGE